MEAARTTNLIWKVQDFSKFLSYLLITHLLAFPPSVEFIFFNSAILSFKNASYILFIFDIVIALSIMTDRPEQTV